MGSTTCAFSTSTSAAAEADFNNDGAVNAGDVVAFVPDLQAQASTPGSGTDMNCDGVVNASDVALFVPSLTAGAPT